MTAVYNSVADEDQQLIENKEIFDEQAEKNVLQQKLSASGISLYEMRPSDSYNQLDLIIDGLAFTSDDGLVQTFTAPYDGDYTITAYGANGGTGKGKYQGYRTPGRGGKAEGTIHLSTKLANGTTAVSTKEINNDSWKHVFENIIVFNGSDKVSYTVTQDAVSEYTTEIKASDDGNTIEIINTHVPVAPPKEEPKQEETVTPAAPAPVVEIKTEPTTTVIETPNKQTGISFIDGLFG